MSRKTSKRSDALSFKSRNKYRLAVAAKGKWVHELNTYLNESNQSLAEFRGYSFFNKYLNRPSKANYLASFFRTQ